MKLSRVLIAVVVFGLATSMPAQAAPIVFSSPLAPEAVGATGTGFTTVTFDPIALTMQVEADFSGLSGTTTVAHIHCCTAVPRQGTVGVATQLPSFAGFPTGVSAGAYDATFDLALASSWNPAFVTANGGTTQGASAALLNGMLAGRAYLNVHSTTFPGGEIRGFLAVPEPTTAVLVGMSFAVLGLLRRRRRQPAVRAGD